MSLTKKQIEEYRKKLRDSEYMREAINGIADKLSELPSWHAAAEPPYAEPEINNTEEKEMAKNSLYDLNDHLFERIEWLTDQEVKGKDREEEIKRSEMVVKVSMQIQNNAMLLLKAKELAVNAGVKIKMPTMLEDKTT
jgi:hypothetical protein